MKKSIIIQCIVLIQFLSYTADFDYDYEYIEEKKEVCVPKIEKKCRTQKKGCTHDVIGVHVSIHTEICDLEEEVCEEERKEECRTETEYKRVDLDTYLINHAIDDMKRKSNSMVKEEIKKRKEISNKINRETWLTNSQIKNGIIDAKRRGVEFDPKYYEQLYEQKIIDSLFEYMKDVGERSGENLTLDKYNDRVRGIINSDLNSKLADQIDQEIIEKEHKQAKSLEVLLYHRENHGLDGDYEYIKSEYSVDPLAIPIVLDENQHPTFDQKKSGRPIFRRTTKKGENIQTDFKNVERIENIKDPVVKYKDLEVYVNDTIKPEDIVANTDELGMYIIVFSVKPDTTRKGTTQASVYLISMITKKIYYGEVVSINVIEEPKLVYKANREKSISEEIEYSDVIEKTLDPRYEVMISNTIDNKTIGRKDVELKIIDRQLNRTFTGYRTDITLTEKMKELKFNENPDVYVNEQLRVDHLISPSNIPEEYEIKIIGETNTKTTGLVSVNLEIRNKVSTSVWTVTKQINVIKEPSVENIDTINLEILQNDNNVDRIAKEYINKLKIDLNGEYADRYSIKLKKAGDVSKTGKSVFVYTITDNKTGRTFDVDVQVNVAVEEIEPEITIGKNFNQGHDIRVDEIVSGIDKSKYDIKIINEEELKKGRLNIGKFNVRLQIKSKATSKVWDYDVEVEFVEKTVSVADITFEKGEHISLDIIRKLNNIDEKHKVVLRAPNKLTTDKICKYNVSIEVREDSGIYYVINFVINIVENKTVGEIYKIDRAIKEHILTNTTEIANNLADRLKNVHSTNKNNFWVNPSVMRSKYIGEIKSNSSGAMIGYDKSINGYTIGVYGGYERLQNALKDVSTQKIYNVGGYFGKNLYNSSIYNKYIGTVLQYTLVNSDLNIKNTRDEIVGYNQSNHNIIINGFVGLDQKNSGNINLSANLGNTILIDVYNKLGDTKQDFSTKKNIMNEIYFDFKLNKRINKLNLFANSKAGWLLGVMEYNLNGMPFKYIVNYPDVSGKIGFDYDLTKNIKMGLNAFVKNNNIFKYKYGGKINLVFSW